MPSAVAAEKSNWPLCVDLDGTVIKTDMLFESMVQLLRRNPLYVFLVLAWWVRGRAYLKSEIAKRVQVNVAGLPLCTGFLDFLRKNAVGRRPVLLVTASDRRLAEDVSRHLGVFSDVLASDGHTNLRGKTKAATLAERFGERGFDYAGNSTVDLPVWGRAREALVVNAGPGLAGAAGKCSSVSGVFDPARSMVSSLVEATRPHQWVKNLIVFVPLIAAHKVFDSALLLNAVVAFVAFSLCASGVYILNDLVDLDADRQHPTKCKRPLASGDLPLSMGLLVFPLLIGAGLALGFVLSWSFAVVLASYLALTSSYSWRLKQLVLVDVFCLAALYTLRLIGGHEATHVKYSSWLLVFSMFIFLSLALVKRFVEVDAARSSRDGSVKGRGYGAGDAGLVAMLGAASGYLAVLVLALYVNSQDVRILYRHPNLLLLICALLLFWISRVWLLAHRGQMHDDPVVFALKDRTSYLIGGITLVVLWLATGG